MDSSHESPLHSWPSLSNVTLLSLKSDCSRSSCSKKSTYEKHVSFFERSFSVSYAAAPPSAWEPASWPLHPLPIFSGSPRIKNRRSDDEIVPKLKSASRLGGLVHMISQKKQTNVFSWTVAITMGRGTKIKHFCRHHLSRPPSAEFDALKVSRLTALPPSSPAALQHRAGRR